jgi:hypothetical protein
VKVDASTHVVLNVWGGESFDHITPGRTREIVRELRRQLGGEDAKLEAVAGAVTSAMAREIWVENPANRVAYLPNVKGDRARVRTARGWEERASRDVENAMHSTAVYVTSQKQPMETDRDIKLMTPLLRAMDEGPVARAGMRAALIEMRPERALRGPREGLTAIAGEASERQGPAEILAKVCGGAGRPLGGAGSRAGSEAGETRVGRGWGTQQEKAGAEGAARGERRVDRGAWRAPDKKDAEASVGSSSTRARFSAEVREWARPAIFREREIGGVWKEGGREGGRERGRKS